MTNKKQIKELEKILLKREMIFNSLSRFKEFLDNFDHDINPINEVSLRYQKFQLLWDQFDTAQTDIEILSPTPAIEQEKRQEFEDGYFDLATRADFIISDQTMNSPPRQDIKPKESLDDTGLKFQPISIPKFSGNYEDWLSFSDIFKAMIHNNDKIPIIKKFYCLRSSLTGIAEGVIKSIEVTEANYLGAWELLEKRFLNIKLITEKHIKSLFDLPKLSKESGKDLRHLVDNFQKHLQALQALGQPINSWDTLLIYLVSNKLDSESFKAWQEHAPAKELPKLENLTDFLLKRCQMLESLPINQHPFNTNSTKYSKTISKPKQNQVYNKTTFKSQQANNACFHAQQQPSCALCKRQHYLFKCSQFLNLSVDDRVKRVKELKLCENCLKSGHSVSECVSRNCLICKSFHNTLLHNNQTINSQTSSSPNGNSNPSTVVHAIDKQSETQHSQVILSTAIVYITNRNGRGVPCRILLDCGSQSNFVTESTCNLLGLKRQKTSVPITGINATSTQVSQRVTATICSTITDFKFPIEFLVIPKITNNIPSKSLNTNSWEFPSDIPLADPTWNSPSSIDALIGARHFWDLIQSERFTVENSFVTLQETKLGYIICNTNESNICNQSSLCHLTTLDQLDDHIQLFWKTEEFNNTAKVYTGEDLACEIHYKNTVSRDEHGRYIVEIPFKQNPSKLGVSRENALRQFKSLESKLVKNPCLYQEYRNFMKEYQLLDHMEEAEDQAESTEYFLPHHAVVKESSTTTKVREVFNASSKTSSGISLNEIQMIGPTIQDSLFSILIRFRMSNYVLIADIEKMYRQTWIHPSQTKFQKIFWRDSLADKIKTFKLLTITYGTASAPYLAVRTLHQLFIDETHNYPSVKETERDFYVDNYMTGCNTIYEGQQIQKQITSLLQKGGYHLRKWCSNNEQLLSNIAPEDKEKLEVYYFEDYMAHTVKTLGLVFIPSTDQFIFIAKPFKNNSITKRSVISEIAQVYDPLGIIGPIILKAKTFMQQLWRLGVGWDETIPEPLLHQWTQFRQSFSNIETMKIPRQVTINPLECKIEIHAFSDASEIAYGTCIYIRNIDNQGRSLGVQLLCSKSRVAPLKSTSLPRLELSAALLMGQLVHSVKTSLNITEDNIFYWTDSTVVLAWLSAASSNWATYVANRVAKIQELTNINNWHHVSGTHNPADIISRGMDVSELIKSTLWWHGPKFLHKDDPLSYTSNFNDLLEIPERKTNRSISPITTTQSNFDVLHKFSSWRKLIRVIAYCKRFINNARLKNNSPQRQVSLLTLQEPHDATNTILKLVQHETFHYEINLITKGKELPKDSKLLKLHPMLDENCLLRVGGRIDNANVSINQKHPIILPSKHHVTKLIATDYHIQQLHCGPQSLLATLRLKYWPINGRFLVNNIVRSCIKCFRVKPSNATQLMGQLPKTRVQPSRPFTHCGVDYAGPIQVRLNNLRKPIIGKAFISIFICFATKAIHTELVEDLSTESFISALRRFIARRGKPSCIFSDNSTTFKGSSNYLKELKLLHLKSETQETLNAFNTSNGIEWSFIPPYSPNMGGLWEASIKLVKHHLRRTMGTRILSYVTIYTLLTEIEACVNSRPLVPLTNNPSDLSALTPAHFLIGNSLASIPEHHQDLASTNKLTKLKQIQEMKQQFWSRWSSEYLGELQKRSKWTKSQPNLKTSMLVLLKDDNLPALRWKLGRIVDLRQGADNRVRVVSVKTEEGITSRAISKICPLPEEEEAQPISE